MHKHKIYAHIHTYISKPLKLEGTLMFDSARSKKNAHKHKRQKILSSNPRRDSPGHQEQLSTSHRLALPVCRMQLITPQGSGGNKLPAPCTVLQAHKMQRPAWLRAQSPDASFKVLFPPCTPCTCPQS